MRLDTPRLEPMAEQDIDPELRPLLGPASPPLNIFRTLAHHPKLAKRWLVFGAHVLGKSSLEPREREMAILRIGYLCQSGYEWGQHVEIGKQCGLSQEEIDRIAVGPDADGWNDLDRAILRAVDEAHADSFVSDATWRELAAHYSPVQLLDLLFAIGQYAMVSLVLNSLGVQAEPGGLPELPPK